VYKPKILAFAGSARSASWNKQLVRVAAYDARTAGADVTLIDLRDFPMPIYDGDEEERDGIPQAALAFRELMLDHQGLLIASPEYNGSVSALLKNALDWCSRPAMGQDGLAPFRGKTVALLAASVSPFGGVRSLSHLRGIMSKMGSHVLADEILVPFAPQAFDAQGALTNDMVKKLLALQVANLVATLTRLHAAPPP
jgi:NAD(P)H-dependent FMN reductase